MSPRRRRRRAEVQRGLPLPCASYLCPAWFFQRNRPFFRHDERAVNEALGEIQPTAVFEFLAQRFQDPFQRAITHSALEAAVAGLVRWIPVWQVGLLRARPQNPQDAVHHLATAAPGPSAPIRPARQLTNQRPYHCPLLIGQMHRHVLLRDAAYHRFMRWLVVIVRAPCPDSGKVPRPARAPRSPALLRRLSEITSTSKLIHYTDVRRLTHSYHVTREIVPRQRLQYPAPSHILDLWRQRINSSRTCVQSL